MRFVVHLVEEGHLTSDQGIVVLQAVCRRTPPLGTLIVRRKLLSLLKLRQLLDLQQESGRPLGQIAVREGFITEADLRDLLEDQRKATPSAQELVVELGMMNADAAATAHQRFISLLS